MHEYGIAEEIVNQVLRRAEAHGGSKPRAAWVQLGALCGMDPEVLEAVFPITAAGTAAENVRLFVRVEPAECRCRACDVRVLLEGHVDLLVCESCGSTDMECPPSAQRMLLSQVEFEDEGQSLSLPREDIRPEYGRVQERRERYGEVG